VDLYREPPRRVIKSTQFTNATLGTGGSQRRDSLGADRLIGSEEKMEDLLIRVPESAHKGFLDRETVAASVREGLKPWCDLVEDIVSYGSNLIPRCFVSSERGLKDAVVLAILLRQVVAMLDSVHILLSQGACHAAQLPARALFESSVCIDWILLADSDKKCLYYYVHNLRRKRIWARRAQAGSVESKEFMALMGGSGVQLTADLAREAKKQLERIEEALSKPKFARVSAHFDSLRGRKKYEPTWYAPFGPRNLREVAAAVDRLAEYTILYSIASQVMHGSSYEQHIAIGKGDITFQPIRSLEGFENVFRFSAANALATYRKVLHEYRYGELENFSRKYVEKWQKHFLNFPPINVKVSPIQI
jgi:Family of unknown function (DUF5677)